MALATDQLLQKAVTLQTNLQALVPQLWAAEIERNLRHKAVLEQSVLVNNDLMVPNAGDTVYIPSLPDLAAASQLTEGTDMVDIALSNATSVPFVPKEYGISVGATRKALDRIKYDGMAQIMDRLAYSMSLKIETGIAQLWNATVPSVGGSLTQVYANGKTSTTITSSDLFNDDLILAGKQQLMSVDALPYDDGMWMLFISPKQYRAMLQDANIRNDLRYAQPSVLLRGEVGVVHNCHVIVTNYIQSQTENSVTVYDALLTTPRWAAIAYKRRPELVIDPTLYDYGRRRRFGVVGDFDIELLHNERAVVLKSV